MRPLGSSEEDNIERKVKGKGKEKEKEKEREKGKEKGKGKEDSATSSSISGIPNTNNSNPHAELTSSRLASSTTNLMGGSMISPAHGLQSPNFLLSGKAESSSITQHSETAFRETARLTHASSSNAQLLLGTTFRSSTAQGTGSARASGFSEFLETTKDASGEPDKSGPREKTAPLPIPHAIAAAMNDGSEVVDLLETEFLGEDNDEPYMTNEELLPLRRALFREGAPTGTSWDSVLNFVPEFISNRGINNSDENQQLAQHLGLSNAAEARDIWFSQWDDVLSSYTDEVWGDLSPLVMAARQELKAISATPEGATGNGLNALRRLQQILAHVRGPL
ncbi:hypothetical protein F4803DRAFT_543596 [Xylaria telfairii]|nr:hypothetical protein F4803DRAFT_543596 [Xylaria telfairii]